MCSFLDHLNRPMIKNNIVHSMITTVEEALMISTYYLDITWVIRAWLKQPSVFAVIYIASFPRPAPFSVALRRLKAISPSISSSAAGAAARGGARGASAPPKNI